MTILIRLGRGWLLVLTDLDQHNYIKPMVYKIEFPFRRCCLVIGLLAVLPLRATTLHVFLQGGQSNADGRADPTGLPTDLQSPQSDVFFYSNYSSLLTTLRPNSLTTPPQFGPEITFGRSMADYYAPTGDKVAILKFAGGGSNLYSQWAAGGTNGTSGDGELYKGFQTVIASGMNALRAANPTATIVTSGMIWMQGEGDAVDATNSLAYGNNLKAFIQDIRLTYGANLPFVIGELSSKQSLNAIYLNNVRAGQESAAAALANTGLVKTDDFSLKANDLLHFDAAGQQAMGSAFATSMQQLTPIPEPSTYTALAALGVLGFAYLRRRHQA